MIAGPGITCGPAREGRERAAASLRSRAGLQCGWAAALALLLIVPALPGWAGPDPTVARLEKVGTAAGTAPDLEALFRNPPEEARPWVLWHWVHGAVSKEGITADLEAMKSGGIGGAYLLSIRDVQNPPVYSPAVRTLTPEWWDMLRHAFAEADRLGLKLGLHSCDGFATAGGPWITPELAMQKVVWSETIVEAGQPLEIALPQPPTNEGHHRDIATLALPVPDGWETHTRTVVPRVTTSLGDLDVQFLVGPAGEKQVRTTDPCWIQYAFDQPFTLRSLVIRNWPLNYGGLYHATRLKIEVSDDGQEFRPHFRLTPPRHGWQDWDADYTFSVPEVRAKYFRFVHDPADAEEGGEDLNGAKWRPRLILRALELSSAARIDNFEGKSGVVWRKAAPVAHAVAAVPAEVIIDLSSRVSPEGRLTWEPPAGRWLVLRFGHTPTGHRNETAGAGKGLESDKFNPAATRLQFDRWFGESIRQVGEERAKRVLKYLLQDSWEAGSQNWSPMFREEFTKRRGSDLLRMLPALAGIPVSSVKESETFLENVCLTISDLTDENFFGVMAELAHAAGVEYVAEATAPTMMGDGMRHFGRVDIPMGEFWLRSPTHDKPNDIADAVSGAHVYGKNIVQAEAFTQLGIRWDEHPGLLKPIADENFARGINRMVFHVFVQNPWLDRRPGMTLDRVGLYFQRDQTWWPEVKAWTDYIARCSALLQAGVPVVDVAYFTNGELPFRAFLPEQRPVPLPEGYQADTVPLLGRIGRLHRSEDDRIRLSAGANYAVVVDDPTDDPGADLRRAGVAPDLLVQGEGAPANAVRWTHRKLAGDDIYFVANARKAAFKGTLVLRSTRVPEIWNPVTGRIERDVPHTRTGEGGRQTAVSLELEALGSRFIVMRSRSAAVPAKPLTEIRLESAREITGPWQVSFDAKNGGPAEPVDFAELVDWTTRAEFGIRHYSGSAVYRTTFRGAPVSGSSPVWLDLGSVRDLARVFVNGQDCGIAWTPPFRVDIAKAVRAGDNELEIRVTNTWANRIYADGTLPENERVTWTTAPASTRPEKLQPAGLLGPVRIVPGGRL